MDANFKKFKKKVWLEILIKCISFGLAAAFLAVDAVFVPCRLFRIDLLLLYYILIGLGGFILGALVAFLIFRTNDKKIAMRLDRELGLYARVQTAYEYGGQDSDILDLQRADASAALGGISVKSLRFANIAALILSGVIAAVGIAALPVTASVLPAIFVPKSDEPPEEPPRDVTEWEWAALDDLIEYVRTTKKADAVVKTGMLLQLESLKGALLNGVSNSSLSAFVENTVANIHNVVKDANDRGISEEQKGLNTEDETYVINKLYEIFNIRPVGDNDGDDTPGSENKPPQDDPGKNPDDNPGGEIVGNNVPFFDPETGYTTASNSAVRDKYYEIVERAFEEGTISREEWEYIMATYFADLNKNEENQ
ncbi:MAG: hypothetical protein J1G05_02075 [Clostridiales bacterium]|nr:hypothetical protein [Clostridiales bacterium]